MQDKDAAPTRTTTMGTGQETLGMLRERFRLSSVRLGGAEWRYLDTGASGRPAVVVVLLPGALGTAEVFFKPLLRLGHRLRMVAVDFPANPDLAALADGVVALLGHLRLPRASLVGSSLGSYVGQVVGARYPQRVERLFLGNAFVDVADQRHLPAYDPGAIAAAAPEALKAQRLEHLRHLPEGDELRAVLLDLVGGQSPESVKARALGVAAAAPAPLARLDGDEQRILLLECGDDTTITPAEKAAIRQRYAASAQHVVLPHGGHYPHVLVPDDYCALLARFVAVGAAGPAAPGEAADGEK